MTNGATGVETTTTVAAALGIDGARSFTSKDGIEGVLVARVDFVTAAQKLRDEHGFIRFLDLTVVDWPDEELRFEVQALLFSMEKSTWLRLKTRTDGELASLTSCFAAAHNYEREAFDMFGVRFIGHPQLTRILMPDAWPNHPLRRDEPLVTEPVDFVITRDVYDT